MIAKLRSWWQKTRTPLEIAIIFASAVLLIALIVVVIIGYIFHWDWTGLVPYTSPPHPLGSDFQPGKTLWDWLQLLIIPVVLAVGGYLFNYTASKNEQKNTQLHNQTERDIAADNQREEALQSYIDKMSELLLEKQLRESKPDDEVRKIGRVRTLTVLPRLDSIRKRSTLLFLHESGLIAKEDKNIIDLSNADVSNTDLSRANLSNTDLSEAKVTTQQLDTTRSVARAILPDGTKHL
jgi:Pentapeptide repeats (8 copies)